jgi:eukaryotic-like serine/threonine-protein kinase
MTLPDRQRWAQLSPLLEALLELHATARAARLAELRARDAALADELEAMLVSAERAEASNFLIGDAQAEGAAPSTLVGEPIGAYVIEASLGHGGTGSVWRARRVDGRFEGAVAIKLLHLSLIGRAGALRFEREGAILAAHAPEHRALARCGCHVRRTTLPRDRAGRGRAHRPPLRRAAARRDTAPGAVR